MPGRMKLDVGPVAPASALIWTEWARQFLGELRTRTEPSLSLPTQVVEDLEALTREGPTRAAFAAQLRPAWPTAALAV